MKIPKGFSQKEYEGENLAEIQDLNVDKEFSKENEDGGFYEDRHLQNERSQGVIAKLKTKIQKRDKKTLVIISLILGYLVYLAYIKVFNEIDEILFGDSVIEDAFGLLRAILFGSFGVILSSVGFAIIINFIFKRDFIKHIKLRTARLLLLDFIILQIVNLVTFLNILPISFISDFGIFGFIESIILGFAIANLYAKFSLIKKKGTAKLLAVLIVAIYALICDYLCMTHLSIFTIVFYNKVIWKLVYFLVNAVSIISVIIISVKLKKLKKEETSNN